MTITIKSNQYKAGSNRDEFSARNYRGAPKVDLAKTLIVAFPQAALFRVIAIPFINGKAAKAVVLTPPQLNPTGIRSIGFDFLTAISDNLKWGRDIQYFGKSAFVD